MSAQASRIPWIRVDRGELAGAFGDIGTDVPLLVALVTTCGLDPAGVCVTFGLLQIATGLAYGIPMPVQPLKAMAAIVLAERLSAGTLAGGGLVVGASMLLLSLTGLLDWLARVVPREVVRGIQLGLGLTLAWLAFRKYVVAEGAGGLVLAAACALLLLALRKQHRVPGPLVVVTLGFAWAVATGLDPRALSQGASLRLPTLVVPTAEEIGRGALLLALPQLPLSLANSVLATSQTSRDLFPERAASVRKIGVTYGLMNLIGPLLGGVPACHGCGGLAGFHGFGARTGGAPVIYGALYLLLGLAFAPVFGDAVRAFPMPVLGVILAFEAVRLVRLARDVASEPRALAVAATVAGAVVLVPYGYVVGLAGGVLLARALRRRCEVAPVSLRDLPGPEVPP
jgi:MFS superfamily sulfate permease-like transporter